MGKGLEFDEEESRRYERRMKTPELIARRRALLRTLDLHPGERVLDVGSGPGFLASEMAAEVGPSGQVHGIDVSESMIALARAECANQPQAKWLKFEKGYATKLPFPDGRFDLVVSTQVYEYVSDITTALAEAFRVLRPGGRILVADVDWDSVAWRSTDRLRMDRVLEAWEEHLADPHLPRTLGPRLREAGFVVKGCEVVPLLVFERASENHQEFISMIADFVAGRRGVQREEVEAWTRDLRELSAAGLYFFCMNQCIFLAAKPPQDGLEGSH